MQYGNAGYANVVELDAGTGLVLRTFVMSQYGIFGTVQGTAIAPDGSRLYVALEDGDLVTFDLVTGARGPTLAQGGGFGMALSPDGELLYVTRGGELLIVDRASLALLRTVAVGGMLRRAGVRPDGVALVANEGGSVVFVE